MIIEHRTHLPATVESVGLARAFVSDALRHDRYTGAIPPVLLLTSELVSNAVVHVGRAFELVVEGSGDSVRVDVIDAGGETQPAVMHPEPDEIGGRGLQMVERVASHWGVDEGPGDHRTVWFSCDEERP
ncbi:MAG TPA: ATP-binding protein [Acidimicrobiales bacterium]|nr:ATP-binding protein [Acidimicrobiales bacterium]